MLLIRRQCGTLVLVVAGAGRRKDIVIGAVECGVIAQQKRGAGPLRQREEIARTGAHRFQSTRALEPFIQHQFRSLETSIWVW